MKSMARLSTLLVFVSSLIFSACGEKVVVGGDVFFRCYPRECTEIFSLPLQMKKQFIAGAWGYTEEAVAEDGVKADEFIYWLMTGADDLDSLVRAIPQFRDRTYEGAYHLPRRKYRLAQPIPSLERQLLNDYSRGSGSGSGTHAANLVPWEYRVTGVKDFKIVALTSLFGLPAETSLNHFFSFYKLEPRQIISSQSKTLLWGYSDQEQVTSIGQWLSMHPMAQPVMMLRLNTMPQEVPVKTRFVTILTTTDGKELRDTLQVLLK